MAGRSSTFASPPANTGGIRAAGKERTEWHSVALHAEGTAKIAEQYLRKGSKVYIEGALKIRKWQDQSGADRYSTEIVLRPYRGQIVPLDAKREGGGEGDRDDRRDDYSGGDYSNDEMPF